MRSWQQPLLFDPIPLLVKSRNTAIAYFCKKDLLEHPFQPIDHLWQLQAVEKIIKTQNHDGSWTDPGGGRVHIRSQQNYNQIETYRMLRMLIEKYRLARNHPSIKKAADYLLGFQTVEGDFRGIYGNQYSPNYSAAIMELLIKAGYSNDKRIKQGFRWLLSLRQDDGGWAIPF